MKWSSFKYLVKQGWHSMVANRLMTLASIGVLVACLMITGVAALLSVNVTSYVDYLETLNEIVFFIDDAAPAETVEALKTQIPADGNVAACEYVPKAAAVEEMREYLGDYGDIMNDYAGEGNTENPLPASFRVSVTDVADLAPTVERIKAMGAYTATAEDGTASDANVFYKVNSPSELSSTLVNLKRIVNYIGWGLVAVLGVVSVVVISNTIRLTVFARRKEINIMKFVHPAAVLCGGHDGGRYLGRAGHGRCRRCVLRAGAGAAAAGGALAERVHQMHVAVYGYHLAAAGRVCAVRRRHRRRGLRVQHPQAPEGVIFFEHRSFLWKSIKNWFASYVWCLPH